MDGAGGLANANSNLYQLRYQGMINQRFQGVYQITWHLFLISFINICLGIFFAWRAKTRIRHKIF